MSQVSDAICQMVTSLPGGFQPIDGRPGFWFRASNPPHLYSFIIIQHSAKHTAIGVDLVSSVLRYWDKQYGRHQLVMATGLQNVRLGSQSTPIEAESYVYGNNPKPTFQLICKDLTEHALPWFAAHAVELQNDPLVLCGIEAIANEPLPSLEELKSVLRKKASAINASKKQRRETGILAVHLLAWAVQQRPVGN